MSEPHPNTKEDGTGPMSGLTFSVVAPTLGLLLVLGLVAWQQCASPPPEETPSQPTPVHVAPHPTHGLPG
jgi:hypothetical protein